MTQGTIDQLDAVVAGTTTLTRFIDLIGEHADVVALRSMSGDAPGSWNTWTFGDVAALTAQAAAGLQSLGVTTGERVLLMMRNRPDFHWLDLAAQFVRATPVSIYNSSSPEEIQYLAHHAEAEIAIVEDAGFLDRLLKVRADLPALQHIFVIEPPADGLPDGVRPASELFGHGAADLAALAADTSPDDIATLIYTSGTTGPPKGVMISQYNVVYTVESLQRCIDFDQYVGKRAVSYLPMAHIAERMMSHYQWAIGGYTVSCCPDPNQLSAYLREVHPEILFGVPRVSGRRSTTASTPHSPPTRPARPSSTRESLLHSRSSRPSARARPRRSSSTPGRSSTASRSATSEPWWDSMRSWWVSPVRPPSRVRCSSGTTRSACR